VPDASAVHGAAPAEWPLFVLHRSLAVALAVARVSVVRPFGAPLQREVSPMTLMQTFRDGPTRRPKPPKTPRGRAYTVACVLLGMLIGSVLTTWAMALLVLR
jgi:hypothetical protein